MKRVILATLIILGLAANAHAEKAHPYHRREVTREQLVAFMLHGTPLVPAGADIFFAQVSAGANNGTNCANAFSVGRFNTNDSNWTAGNTLHLCGTFSTQLVLQNDGSSGSSITIKFETNAQLSDPTLGTNQAFITKTSGNWLTIDGGTNGIIQATANGSSPTFPNQNDFYGIHFPTCNNCEVKNLTIQNLFVKNTFDTQGSCNAVSIDAGINNHIHHNIVHDMVVGIFFGLDGSINNEVDHNTAFNINWDYGGGSGGLGMTSYLIHDNDGHDWANWDDNSGPNAFHHNGIHVFVTGSGTSTLNGLFIYNNYFHGTTGTNTTAQIFIESPGDGNISATVFNNLLVADIAASQWNNGFLGVHGSSISIVSVKAYNNTLYATTAATQQIGFDFASSTNLTSQNNLFDNARMGGSPGMTIAATNNWYFNALPFDWGGSDTFAQWKSDCGCDANSSSGVDPNINVTTFVPNTGSGLINFGVNLNSVGIIALDSGAPQTFGVSGTCGTGCLTRPASAAWDGGAYPFSASAGGTPTGPPGTLPPTDLKAKLIKELRL